MKRLSTLFCIALGLAVSPVLVNAQSTGPSTSQNIPNPSSFSFPGLRSGVEGGPLPAAASRLKTGPKREDRVVKKGKFAPADSDVKAHLFLLSLENTGIMRLLPREAFDGMKHRDGAAIGGAYFSFFNRSHEYNYGADISYDKGDLIAGGFAGPNYGFLTDLGDTPLEPIVASDPRAAFLLLYTPPRKEYEVRREQKTYRYVFPRERNSDVGVTVDGVLYRKNLLAKLHHTYLVRAITYSKSDLLVALRVINKSDDGGLTIAWKILKEFTPPKLLPVIDARDY